MPPHRLKLGRWHMPLPASRSGRVVIGVLLVLGGVLGFLPILGFWMVPLGLMVLSIDIPAVRRRRRRFGVWWERRRRAKAARANAASVNTAPGRPIVP